MEIKILLIRAGITQSSIARKLGVTNSFVNQVIKGHRHTERVKMAIAEAVGKPVEKLWPSRPSQSKD